MQISEKIIEGYKLLFEDGDYHFDAQFLSMEYSAVASLFAKNGDNSKALEALREADAILREEIANAGLAEQIWQFFVSVPDFRATGVRDGKRLYEWPAIIRCVNTVDAMTAEVPEIDWAVLKKITARILAEVPGICRVCYDLSPKPSATIEWE